MADPHSALAEQFTEMPQQKEAATLGMWTFLATEVLFFGVMFTGYLICRQAYPQAFAEASRHTVLLFGTLNTAVLLTSSLSVALAIHALKSGRNTQAVRLLVVTVVLGVVFLGVKGLEYHKDIEEHLWPGSHFRAELPPAAQLFWFLYWVMTGVHALHVTVGTVLLAIMARMTARGRFSTAYYTPVEMSGLYWHFVDVVWIDLYPLLYLVHRYGSV